MAALYRLRQRRRLRRPKIYRDRTNPLDTFDDIELHDKLRFRRQDILELTDLLTNDLELDNRGGAVPPVLQVCVTLRYFATGTFQNAIGEMIGISQPTVSLIVKRTMNALLQRFPDFIHPPAMQDITRNKIEFQEMAGFPNVFGCIDGTHIKIVAPPGIDEDVYVNRKNVHSINVQIVCDARLRILDCVATSPGSFHDARILRESAFWRAMEDIGVTNQLDALIQHSFRKKSTGALSYFFSKVKLLKCSGVGPPSSVEDIHEGYSEELALDAEAISYWG
ncbi:low quality protein: putative nuclease harbi1 [Plakobranchus ocellatus]|uniref:Putative nuclease HARBI1 n=1 Tax=Plakobranchus ocellatus TaxID=259542 RepID=A0AAV3Y5E8_9GAST|nr:low quality protein: putative nuclease harbi1 [Plakobranchus ocellatus]